MKPLKGLVVSLIIILSAILYLVFGKDFIPSLYGKKEFAAVPQAERIRKDLLALYSTPKPRSVHNLESLNLAATYIEDEWKKLGLSVERQEYRAEQYPVHNLIVRLGPTEGPRWVIGAHYDVCEEEMLENRGADDNASGVAVLLELSRLVVENKIELKRPLELVAYSTEEPPFFGKKEMGSYVHAESLSKANIEVKGMLSLEMLGYYSQAPGSQDFPFAFLKAFYPSVGNFLMVAGDLKSFALSRRIRRAFRKTVDLPTRSINAPDVIRGIQFSDHRNYSLFGYRAAMLTDTAFYRNKNYHRPTDVPENLNYPAMAEIAKALAFFVAEE